MTKVFFSVFIDRDHGDGVQVPKLAKRERGQYLAILTERTWLIKDLLDGIRGNFLRDPSGSPERVR